MPTLLHNFRSILLIALGGLAATLIAAPAAAAATSAWDQPTLVNPITVTLSDTNRTLNLSNAQDYILQCPTDVMNLTGKIQVWGGHNVVLQNCNEYVTNPTGDWAGDFQNQTGTLWVSNVHFGGTHLTGGIQLQEPGATVVLRGITFDQVNGTYNTNHAECIQTWSGPARFLIDGLTCNTTYQGLYLLPNQYGGATPTVWDFRNINIQGQGAYDLWLGNVGPGGTGRLPDFTVQNVVDCDPTNPRTMDGTSDSNQAWANVQGCPTVAGGAKSSDPTSTDPTELGDPFSYQHAIEAATPLSYWRLAETAGPAADDEGADAGTFGAAVTLGAQGPLVGDPDTGAALQTPTAQIQTAQAYAAPNQYTVEAWFKAQPGSGAGQIVGMNQSQNGSASNDDHSVYLTPTGQIGCYYYSAGKRELFSASGYEDGNWHLVECAKGSAGMTLDVDGQKVAANTFTGAPFSYSGYWVIGNRNAGDGAKQAIAGSVGQVAIYNYALSQAQDANHWAVGRGQPSTGN